ncbi:bile acid:sodium symporter [Massilia sp. CCM 8693]|uniref:Bile acid:sodium symporter n=1 Tax=Massilia aquatica TaxID=2609000 RepID=A0ABX0MID4_9BURK|nr:bile acid:sodium symporter [Massilia aquatica]
MPITGLRRGNVAAVVCSASASNFIGIFVTPLQVSAFVLQGAAGGRSTIEAVG